MPPNPSQVQQPRCIRAPAAHPQLKRRGSSGPRLLFAHDESPHTRKRSVPRDSGCRRLSSPPGRVEWMPHVRPVAVRSRRRRRCPSPAGSSRTSRARATPQAPRPPALVARVRTTCSSPCRLGSSLYVSFVGHVMLGRRRAPTGAVEALAARGCTRVVVPVEQLTLRGKAAVVAREVDEEGRPRRRRRSTRSAAVAPGQALSRQ